MTHRGAVLAVAATFAGAGITMASAVSRMPEIKAQVDASTTELAFALVCIGIGSIVAMPFAGRSTQRFGTAPVVAVFAVIACGGWAMIPLASSVPQLALILLLTGVGVGTWDVAMNVQGSMVERASRTVRMPLWHGLFSVGGVVGALAGAGAARIGLPLAWHLPTVSAAMLLVVLISTRSFIGAEELAAPGRVGSGPSSLPTPPPHPPRPQRGVTRTEVLLGLIMLSTALGEGAANDWLAVALVDERGAPAAIGAVTYAGFNLTMAIGRFTGGPFIARFGRTLSLRIAGSIAAAGVLLLCLVPGTAVALAGAAAWGLGLAIVFPSAVSAAGQVPGRADRAIATVSTIGYGGFLFGAPLIGTLAHVIPLLDALLVVAAFALLIVVLAPAARERPGSTRVVARG